jgi:hypothetical protein
MSKGINLSNGSRIHLWVYRFHPGDTIPSLSDWVFVEGFTKDPSDARQVRDCLWGVVVDADVFLGITLLGFDSNLFLSALLLLQSCGLICSLSFSICPYLYLICL